MAPLLGVLPRKTPAGRSQQPEKAASGRGDGATQAVAEEAWLDPATAGDDTNPIATEAVPDHELAGMDFWDSIEWQSMRRRWLPLNIIPNEIRHAVMELRAAVATAAGRETSQHEPERIKAQKCCRQH